MYLDAVVSEPCLSGHIRATVSVMDNRAILTVDIGFYTKLRLWALLIRALIWDPCPVGLQKILLMIEILHDVIYQNVPKSCGFISLAEGFYMRTAVGVMSPTRALVSDPCPLRATEMLTVAHGSANYAIQQV